MHILDEIFKVIQEKSGGNSATSYTASLIEAGRTRLAQKVGEEAIETVIEAVHGTQKTLVEESCDLLYHLLVLWQTCGVEASDVWLELDKRLKTPNIDDLEAKK